MKIDVWSDIICPFCFIGKRKLEMALKAAGITNATIEFHSFELQPSAPQSFGISLQKLLSSFYGMSEQHALGVLAHEEEAARAVGLDFQWRKAQPGNTFTAHRLLHLARSKGLGLPAEERFMHAYFTEGKAIGDPAVLRDLSLQVGLAAADVDAVLQSQQFAAEVRADERRAASMGVHGVPYFLINGSVAIKGAQDIAEFARVLKEQAAKEPTAAPPLPTATATQAAAEPSDSVPAGVVCTDGVCLPKGAH